MTRNDKTIYEAFWANLDSALKHKGMKYNEFSEVTNLSYYTLMGWKAKGRIPDLPSILIISQALEQSIDSLVNNRIKEQVEKEENRWSVYLEGLKKASPKDLRIIRTILDIDIDDCDSATEAGRKLG